MGALVIVESPAKARRIQEMLGSDYTVLSSRGHVRDLPDSASQLPKDIVDPEVRRTVGIDAANHFKAVYVVTDPSKVRPLKDALKSADQLLLATDEDREGEAIAWHLVEVLRPTVPVRRMVFHEITPHAIEQALTQTRDIDNNLVNAQEARRILDRLVGFDVSKVLWRVLAGARSAGRVQSVAVRLVVERERERIAFRSAVWWGIDASLEGAGARFEARLAELAGEALAVGSDFDESGALKVGATARVLEEAAANQVAAGLEDATLTVVAVTSTPRTERPRPPFITSSLQIEGSRKLGWSPDRTMRVAQDLYEQGWITYMRTDSTTLSSEAIDAARAAARSLYGPEYVPDAPRRYDKKVRNAQEAHEAIRPSGESFRSIEEANGALGGDGARLYELDLEAHGRLRDGGRAPHGRADPPRGVAHGGRGRARRPARGAARDRPAGRLPGLPARLRRGKRRSRPGARRPGAPAARARGGDRPSRSASSPRPRTRPSRLRASPRRRSCAAWRSSASAGRARTRRSSR